MRDEGRRLGGEDERCMVRVRPVDEVERHIKMQQLSR